MNRHFPWMLVALSLLLWLPACAPSDETQILKVLNQREEAFKKKDLALYLSVFYAAYRGKDEDFEGLRARIGSSFQTFDRIDYSCWDRSLDIAGDQATVVQQFNLDVEKGGVPKRYSGKEAFLLAKEGKAWKIVKSL
jgi:hypothetical protein